MTDSPLPPCAPRRRLPALQRRAQILSVAKALFTREGIERTSLRAIAAKAGVSATAIYDHFPDKAALMLAIGEDYFTQLIEAMASAGADLVDPRQRMVAKMRAYVTFGLAHPEEYRLIFMTPKFGLTAQSLRFSHRGVPNEPPSKGAQSFSLLENEVRMHIESGALKPANPRALSEAIWACGHGIVSLLITHDVHAFVSSDMLMGAQINMMLDGMMANRSS